MKYIAMVLVKSRSEQLKQYNTKLLLQYYHTLLEEYLTFEVQPDK